MHTCQTGKPYASQGIQCYEFFAEYYPGIFFVLHPVYLLPIQGGGLFPVSELRLHCKYKIKKKP